MGDNVWRYLGVSRWQTHANAAHNEPCLVVVRTVTEKSEEAEIVRSENPDWCGAVLLWQSAVDWNEYLEGYAFQHSSQRDIRDVNTPTPLSSGQ